MTQKEIARIEKIAENFQFNGTLVDMKPWGNGHINDTYLMGYEIDDKECVRYILQRINKNVFPKPEEVMENVVNVTTHLHKKIVENGGDPYRETLNIIPTKEGMSYYKESEDSYWRAMVFITDTICHDVAESPEEFFNEFAKRTVGAVVGPDVCRDSRGAGGLSAGGRPRSVLG